MRAVQPVSEGRSRGGDSVGMNGCQFALPHLDRLPKRIVDDAQFRNLGRDPCLGRIEARDALARARVFHVAEPVPNQLADIKFVIEKPRAALGIAADRRIGPGGALGTGNLLRIEVARHGPRALARGELAEHAADDRRLLLVNLALAMDRLAGRVQPLHDAIAVANSAAGLARLHASAQAAVRLGGKVLEEEGVHRALQADVKLGNLPFGDRGDRHVREAETLVNRRQRLPDRARCGPAPRQGRYRTGAVAHLA